MIKGHTKIELKNEESGEVTVIEEDNMITNGFRNMFIPLCGVGTFQGNLPFVSQSPNNSPSTYAARNSIIDRMLGGLLLFRDRQEENAENYILGGTNEITGRGSTYAYTGIDTILGSYNIQESGRQEDGSYKKVWDFSPNQANGIISSVSLTTEIGGAFGNGSLVEDLSGAEAVPMTGSLETYTVSGTSGAEYPVYYPSGFIVSSVISSALYADGDKNEIIFIKNLNDVLYSSSYSKDNYFYNSKTLTFTKMRFPLTQIGLFLDPGTLGDYEEVEVPIPDAILSQCAATNNSASWYSDDGFLYFILKYTSNACVLPNESLKILKISTEDFSTEVLQVVNTTAAVIRLPSYDSRFIRHVGEFSCAYNGGMLHITNDYLIFNSYKYGNYNYDAKLYRINLKDNTKVSAATFDGKDFACNPDLASYPSSFYLTGAVRIGDYLYLSNGNRDGYVLNIRSNTIRKCIKVLPYYNMIDGSAGKDLLPVCSTRGAARFLLQLSSATGGYSILPTFIPQTLMTINNLGEPVVKTASSSMRVTYTLTEAEEPVPESN